MARWLSDGHPPRWSTAGQLRRSWRSRSLPLHQRAIATELLRDIDRETVDFQPNFDGNRVEPKVLPARFPNLLANGSQGIAVGMATNIPPHNLGEVIDAVGLVARNPDCTATSCSRRSRPDFPTGALICGRDGIRQAYLTGRGSITVRAKADIEETKRGGKLIVVSEIPYMLNKSALEIRIAELVKEGLVDGISDIRDESDRSGIRLVIELKREAPEEVILNQLYKLTPMQTTFGVNMPALVGGRPRQLPLRRRSSSSSTSAARSCRAPS
jgi:DNA gyrase subunit A